MKKKSFLILACLLVLAGGAFASRPITGQPVVFTCSKNFKSSIRNIAALESNSFTGVSIPDVKNIRDRALKDFQVRFNDAVNVIWYTYSDGYMSYFKRMVTETVLFTTTRVVGSIR